MIFYLISLAAACQPQTNSLTVYPTIGEYFSLPLNELFVGNNLEYRCIPDCPQNVTIMNQFQNIHSQTLNYITVGLSSNNTHFVTLTNNSTINLYQFKKQTNNMELLSITPIDPLLTCFNTIFTYTNQILIDCYYEDILQFYYLNKSTMVLMEQFINQSIPINTKILNYYANDRYYLLYAQFYEEYQILTLFEFKEQMINQTTWTYGVKDFDVSNQFIYIIDDSVIYQVYVNQELQFIISAVNRVFYGLQIQAHNFKTFSTQCDYLLVFQYNQLQNNYLIFEAWNGSIILSEEQFGQTNWGLENFQGSFASESFLIVQFFYQVLIVEIGPSSQGNTFLYNYPGYLTLYCYFDSTSNIYYIFSDKIDIFLLQKPQLTIYLNQIQIYSFFILANTTQNQQKNRELCKLQLEYQIINSTDNNIYLAHNDTFSVNYGIYNTTFSYKFNQLSGPLMNVTGAVQNSNLGDFNDATLQQLNLTIQQQFMVTGIYQIWKQSLNTPKNRQILFVGATLTEIFFYDCTFLFICNQTFQESILSPIKQIVITFRYPNSLLVAVNQGVDNVQLYNISYINETLNITKQYLLFPVYTQFFLTYNNIILLLSNHQILIQSLESSDNLTLTGQYINNLLNNYSLQQCNFNPQNIEMNTQYLSSILYINNNNSFIILLIQNTKQIIPQSIIKVNFNIYQLNIINQQLIVSYICEQQICFQVWNVQNLINPQYINDLPNLQMKYNWNIQSDNLFLYVLIQNQTIYVLNPILSYHSSLYYQFQYTGNYFSSLSMGTYSIISIENEIFKLSAILLQQFKPQNAWYIPQHYVTSTFYNFTVNNIFSSLITTQNLILSLLYPFTYIQFQQNTYSQNFTSNEHLIINIIQNTKIQSTGQILYFNLTPQVQPCKIQNYIEPLTFTSELNISNQQITSQLIINNHTLFLQQGATIYYNFSGEESQHFIQLDVTFKYYNIIKCITSVVDEQNNFYQIFNVSQNQNQLYLVEFQLQNFSTSNSFQYLIATDFKEIYKIGIKSPKEKTVFVLGLQNQDQHSYFYALQIQTQKRFYNIIVGQRFQGVKCDKEIIDFTVLYLDQWLTIIIYICQNELRYYQVDNENKPVDEQLFDISELFLSDSTILSQILLLDQYQFSILLLLTTTNSINIIFSAAYTKNEDSIVNMFLQKVAQTIPPYGKFELFQSIEQNGLIFMIFQQESEVVYAIYDWKTNNLQIQNPLITKGGVIVNSLPISVAMNITSHLTGGQIYDIRNDTIHEYSVSSNAILNCTMNRHKDINLTLVAYNNFNSSSLLIVLNYVPEDQWLIGLVVFVSIVFFIAMFVYWYKTKNIKTHDVFFIDEFEIEL